MDITVNMTEDEFLDFIQWKKDRAVYEGKLAKSLGRANMLAKKVCWALKEDPKEEGKVRIDDQDHAAELLDMARDSLA